MPLLERKTDRSWREEIEESVVAWLKLMEERAMDDADPINPQRLFFELSKRLPDGAILSSDSGSAANWYARDVHVRAGMQALALGQSRDDGRRACRTRSRPSSRIPTARSSRSSATARSR